MDMSNRVILSDRLRQVSITEAYIDIIYQEFTSEITTYMTPQPARHRSETEAFVSGAMKTNAAGTNLQLVILDRETGEFLGCSGLHEVHTRTPELGIWLKKAAHNHGYGLEAIGAIIQWANENVSFDYLKYPVDRRNAPSCRIPATYGGIVEDAYKAVNGSGFELDLIEFRIRPSQTAGKVRSSDS